MREAVESAQKKNAEKAARRLIAETNTLLGVLAAEAKKLGITLTTTEHKNLYAILGIKHTGDQKAIRAAYLALIKKYHPDINASPEAHSKTEEANHAYSVLRNKKTKEKYDAEHLKGANPVGREMFAYSLNLLLEKYYEKRQKKFKEFNSRMSNPQSADAINAAIDEVLQWHGAFNSTTAEVFGKFNDTFSKIQRNASSGKKLLAKHLISDGKLYAELQKSTDRAEETRHAGIDIKKGIEHTIEEARKSISAEESKVAADLPHV